MDMTREEENRCKLLTNSLAEHIIICQEVSCENDDETNTLSVHIFYKNLDAESIF